VSASPWVVTSLSRSSRANEHVRENTSDCDTWEVQTHGYLSRTASLPFSWYQNIPFGSRDVCVNNSLTAVT